MRLIDSIIGPIHARTRTLASLGLLAALFASAQPAWAANDTVSMSSHMYMTAIRPLKAGDAQKANALVEQFVKQEPNCVICDTWSVYADNNENPDPACFNPDRLHLNAAGYLKWKSALDPLIARLNLKPGK